jgi:hypothetical protein
LAGATVVPVKSDAEQKEQMGGLLVKFQLGQEMKQVCHSAG